MGAKLLHFNTFFYVFALILTVYFTVNAFSSVFVQPIASEIAEEASVDDYTVIEGIALRSERLLYSDETFGSVRYFQDNGARVAKGAPYAAYYTAELQPESIIKLNQLSNKLSRLEKAIGKSTQYDLLTVEQNIKDSVISFLNNEQPGDFKNGTELFGVVSASFDRKLIQQNGSEYFSDVISSVKNEIQSVYAESNAKEHTVYAPSAGYFYTAVDGYEYLDMNDYENPTIAECNELFALEPEYVSENCLGKLQHYSYWTFISLIPDETASELYIGKLVNLDFQIAYVGSVRVATTVETISRVQNGVCAVSFRCGTLTADLFGLRKESPHLIQKTYSGLKVSNESFRVVDGETGVFVISAQRVIFKPVEIIYVSDTYSLVAPKVNTGSRVLKAKDEIIIGGKDLFDGKIVEVTRYD